jgi:hypothetical protein
MSEVEIVPVTGERAVSAAELKVDRKIGVRRCVCGGAGSGLAGMRAGDD